MSPYILFIALKIFHTIILATSWIEFLSRISVSYVIYIYIYIYVFRRVIWRHLLGLFNMVFIPELSSGHFQKFGKMYFVIEIQIITGFDDICCIQNTEKAKYNEYTKYAASHRNVLYIVFSYIFDSDWDILSVCFILLENLFLKWVYIERLVVTDETAFSMDGTVNTKNTRFLSINAPEGNVYEKKHTKRIAFCVGRTLR